MFEINCPTCDELITIDFIDAPTTEKTKPNDYADAVDLICAVAWESINE